MQGLILYGPPASGKDSITAALRDLDRAYRLFPRLKVGSGRTAGYRMASAAEADYLREHGDIIWENARYGARYIIDRTYLREHLKESITVVHLGQVPGISAVLKSIPEATWLVVSVWCPRPVAAQRIEARLTNDNEARLLAWDATEPVPEPDAFIDTSQMSAEDAAVYIDKLVKSEQSK